MNTEPRTSTRRAPARISDWFRPRLYWLWLAVCAATLPAPALAIEEPLVLDFRPADQLYLEQGQQRINDLTERYFGSSLSRQAAIDLPLLQRLLDEGIVQAEHSEQLQAMGIVMGQLLAQDIDLRWIRYEDNYGVSRALQHRSGRVLFPITMIARRHEVGAAVDVQALYDRALAN